jgi:hypothetical protein
MLFSQTVLFQENFEGATLGMTSSNTGSGIWVLNSRIQAQGLKSDSAVVATGDTIYLTTTNSFSTIGKSAVYLSFSHIAKVEYNDSCAIEVSNDGGTTWMKLKGAQYMGTGQFGNIGNRFTSASYGTDWQFAPAVPQNSWWKHEEFNISALVGNSASVKVRFKLVDGNNNGSGGYSGWFLDSIRVVGSFSELIPPSITLVPPVLGSTTTVDTAYGSSPFDITANITDLSGIDTAMVIYQTSTGVVDTLGMSIISTDTFQASIPFYGFGRSISYYVKAVDNSAAHNADSTLTRTFYCKYSTGGSITIGTGTSANASTGYPTPYANWYYGNKVQYIILASELANVGAGPISSVAFDVASVNSCPNLQNFEIKIGTTTMTSLTAFVPNSNMTTVLSIPTGYQPVSGWNIHTLTTPFVWDGTSNIVIQVCSNNSGYVSNGNASVRYTTSFAKSYRYYKADAAGVCNTSNQGIDGLNRANIALVIQGASSLTNDIGVNQITNPTGGVIAGTAMPVKVKIKNYGVDTITTATINWKYDGVLQTPYLFTDSLKADSLSAEILLGSKTPTLGAHNILTWTDNPNGVSDFNVGNDSAKTSFYACSSLLSGTYTINPSGSGTTNFTSFSDAALALSQCGISGPVTFNVSSGTYNEHIMLPPVNGSSATNTITFQSATGDSSAVTLAYDALGTVDNYVVKLDGTAYITFKGMTFEAQDSTYARAFVLGAGAHNLTFSNNIIKTTVNTIIDDDNMSLIFTLDTIGSNVSITNNVLTNSSRAVLLQSISQSSNWVINNNMIHGHYARAIELINGVSVMVKGNDIKADTMSNVASYEGIYLTGNTGSATIEKNKILTTATAFGYGIRMTSCTFDSLNPATIVNNFVQMYCNSTGTSLSAGIINHESKYINVYFNNVRMSGNQANSTAITLFDGTAGLSKNITIVNNIFANNAGGYIYYVNNVDTSLWVDHHNNLYDYNMSTNFAYLAGNKSDYAAWITASGSTDCDTVIPYFASAHDLHVANNLLNGRAVPITGVTDDIDGDARDATNPDWGADEFVPSPWDVAALEILSPLGGCGLDTVEVVTVRFKNIGSVSINGNFVAKYRIKGSATVVSENVTTSIAPGDTLDYSFTTTADLSVATIGADSTFEIRAWGDLTGDNIPNNDSASISVYSGYVPNDPSVIGDTILYSSSATIYASGNMPYFWETDTSSNYLIQDTVYNTPLLYDTTTYWVSDRAGSGVDSIQVGTGTIVNTHLPIEMYYGYTYSQTIYKASYLNNKAGYINSITYTYQGGTYTDAVKVFVGMTNKSSFSGTTDWISLSDLTLVYDANLTYTAGALTITFTTPFFYDGVSNLVVAFDENTSGYHSSSDEFLCSNLDSDVKSIYFYNDATNPNPANPPTSGYSLGTSTRSPNARFEINAVGCFGNRVPVTVIVDSIPLDDAGLTTLQSPLSGIDLTTNEDVTVTVKNFAINMQDTIPVYYKLDTMPVVADTLFYTLVYGDSTQFTFSQKADLSAYTTHDLKIYTDLGIDQNHMNDTIHTQVTNSMLQYCTNTATSTGYEDLTNVTLANLNNSSAAVGSMYTDFTTSVSPAILAPGQSYPISISTDFPPGYSYAYTCWVNVFIDYNHDGTFDPATELAFSSSTNSSNTVTGTVVVPTTGIVAGMPSRMRVSFRESGSVSTTGPCGTFTWGEVEDYTVMIVPPIPEDAGIVGISPTGTVFTTAATNFTVDVKNYGTDSLVKASIGWMVDTVVKTPINWTGLLYKDSIDFNKTLGSHTFTNGPHIVKAWTSLPNDSVDLHGFNDTLTISVYGCPNALSGNYTLGSATSDYPTFADAFTALQNCGVGGHVIFNVDSGSYSTQLVFGSISGVSDTSTVTFQSATGDSSDVVIVYAPQGTGDNFVVKFNGASYITLKKMTIKSNSVSFGRVVTFVGGNSHINLINSVVIAPQGTSSYMSAVYSSGNADTYCSFINNKLMNGYYGVYWRGSGATSRDKGTIFRGNQITGYYYYGAYLYYQDSIIFENNIVENDPTLGGNSAYGLYVNNGNNKFRFTANKINVIAGSYTSYGIYMTQYQAADTARGLVANNMISCKSGGSEYGLYGYYANYVDYFYNSINLYGSSSAATRSFYLYGGTGLRVLNNALSNTSPGHALYVSSPYAVDTIDNNDYYATGTNLAYWNGNKTTLADLKTATGMDTSSISVDPSFYSNTNLHSTSPFLAGHGFPVAEVLTDFDGQVRDTLTPAIGADEFVPLPIDIGVVGLEYPTTNQCYGGAESVAVRVRNFGTNTIDFSVDTAFIYVVTTGTNAYTFPVVAVQSGTLVTGADTVVLISTTYNMGTSGSYTFNAHSYVATDSNAFNDAMPAVSMNVTSVITVFPYTEDFETFTAGNPGSLANGWTRDMNSYKWIPYSGSTSSSNTGPAGDHTTGSGQYIYTEASASAGYANLVSPCLDLSNFTNPVLKFWYHMYGATMGTLYVQGIDANGNWVDLDTISGPQQSAQTDPWLQRTVGLAAITSGITKIRFHALKGSSYTGDISIDDIYINEPKQWDIGVKQIMKPSNAFSVAGTVIDTVQLKVENFGWDTITAANGCSVSYVYGGQSPKTVNITDTIYPYQSILVDITTPINVLAGNQVLKAYTTFTLDSVYNNDTVQVNYMGVGLENLSYYNNFDGNTEFFTDASGLWQRGVPSGSNINSAHSAPNVWMTDLNAGYTNNATEYLYTPYYDFSSVLTGDSAELSFYHWIDVSSGDAGFIQFTTDGGNTWVNLGYMGDPAATNWYNTNMGGTHVWNATSTGWQQSTYKLGQFTGMTTAIQFRFVFISNASGNTNDGWAIDNFKITLPVIPNDVGVIAITNPSVSTQVGSSANVDVVVKNFGTLAQTSIPVHYSVGGTTESATLSISGAGLLPDSTTTYSFTVPYTSPANDYKLCAYTTLSGDIYKQNDTTCKIVSVTAPAIDIEMYSVEVSPSWHDTTKISFDAIVTIKMVNQGLNTVTSIPVIYKVNSNVQGNETWSGSANYGDTITYSFTTTYKGVLGVYQLCAEANLTGDAVAGNNSTCKNYLGIPDVGIDGANGVLFSVDQNRPNPAKGIVRINYVLPKAGVVRFELRNALGQAVITEEYDKQAGNNMFEIDANKLSSGVYYYTVEFDKQRITKKMVVNN